MKKNARKLRLMLRRINSELFYSISFTSTDINIQGNYKSEVVIQLFKLKFNPVFEKDYGFVMFKRSNIVITLT